jgi:hypothetical protein
MACDDPMAIRPAPAETRLNAYLVLFPDSATQYAMVYPANARDGFLTNVSATISDGTTTLTGSVQTGAGYDACITHAGGLIGGGTCLTFDLVPQFGRTYQFQAGAPGRSSLAGSISIPADFQLVSTATTGAPHSSSTINLTWTRSAGAYRYVVALRQNHQTFCAPDSSCRPRWYAVTTDTTLTGTILPEHFIGGDGPWFVDVYSMNRDTFGYLMTGAGTELFSVPSVGNLQGGFGAVVAYVRRSREIFTP